LVVNFGGVCLKKSEPILRRTPRNEDAPPPPRFTRRHQRKMFLAFRICARPISSKKERTFFFGVLPSRYSGRWRGDNSIRSGMAEFPPHPPSAMPSRLAATLLYYFLPYLSSRSFSMDSRSSSGINLALSIFSGWCIECRI